MNSRLEPRNEGQAEVEFQLAKTGVAVEKLDFRKNNMILGDGKWSIILYESFIGHPDATIFWTPSRI
jgi:hypothetical protein